MKKDRNTSLRQKLTLGSSSIQNKTVNLYSKKKKKRWWEQEGAIGTHTRKWPSVLTLCLFIFTLKIMQCILGCKEFQDEGEFKKK